MKSNYVGWLIWLLSCVVKGVTGDTNSTRTDSWHDDRHRSGRFVIIKLKGDPCASKLDNSVGNCHSFAECKQRKGSFGGFCAYGVGVCCVFTRSCGSTIQHNNTYFQSKNFPSDFKPSGLQSCVVTIQKPNNNICQVRLDFLSAELEGPDENGVCQKDRVILSGGPIPGTAGNVPSNLCGPLSGQSMYLDFASSQQISLAVVTDGYQSQASRKWNIRTSYIPCNSPSAAPSGCLQYRTGVVGTVKIIGYPAMPHLGNLGYAVCIRPEQNARGIRWRRCTGEPEDQSFWMTGDSVSKTGLRALTNCNGDFVLIPMTFDPAVNSDRHCGNSLSPTSANASIISYDRPFIIRVKTDDIEGDVERTSTGFCLEWTQLF